MVRREQEEVQVGDLTVPPQVAEVDGGQLTDRDLIGPSPESG
jgi:hypothetical protein